MTTTELIKRLNKNEREKYNQEEIMTKKEILLELISRVLTGEYELCEVRRSNKGDLQEYDFVLKKASSKGDHKI